MWKPVYPYTFRMIKHTFLGNGTFGKGQEERVADVSCLTLMAGLPQASICVYKVVGQSCCWRDGLELPGTPGCRAKHLQNECSAGALTLPRGVCSFA